MLHRGSVYPLPNHLSICEHYPVKKYFVGLWSDVLIGPEKVMAPTFSFQDWSVWLEKKKNVAVRVGWEQHDEKMKGSLIRTASNSWDRIWHAKSHCGMYDNGGACVLVQLVCVSVHKYVFFSPQMVRNKAALTSPKLAAPLFEYSRI